MVTPDDPEQRARHRDVARGCGPRVGCFRRADLPQDSLCLLALACEAELWRRGQQCGRVDRDEHQVGACGLREQVSERGRVSSLREAVDAGGNPRQSPRTRAAGPLRVSVVDWADVAMLDSSIAMNMSPLSRGHPPQPSGRVALRVVENYGGVVVREIEFRRAWHSPSSISRELRLRLDDVGPGSSPHRTCL